MHDLDPLFQECTYEPRVQTICKQLLKRPSIVQSMYIFKVRWRCALMRFRGAAHDTAACGAATATPHWWRGGRAPRWHLPVHPAPKCGGLLVGLGGLHHRQWLPVGGAWIAHQCVYACHLCRSSTHTRGTLFGSWREALVPPLPHWRRLGVRAGRGGAVRSHWCSAAGGHCRCGIPRATCSASSHLILLRLTQAPWSCCTTRWCTTGAPPHAQRTRPQRTRPQCARPQCARPLI